MICNSVWLSYSQTLGKPPSNKVTERTSGLHPYEGTSLRTFVVNLTYILMKTGPKIKINTELTKCATYTETQPTKSCQYYHILV